MSIELIVDGDGLAVLGNAHDVERFLRSHDLGEVESRQLDLQKVASMLGTSGAAAQVGAEAVANHGRWVKLTAESAEAVRRYGLMPSKTAGVSHAMIGEPGNIKQWVQIATSPASLLGGPVALTAISTLMQQQALQQQMDQIVEYLQEISEKVDDIRRGQKDEVLADLDGVALTIDDALRVRDRVGRVSGVTWSKVDSASEVLSRTQAYALRELDHALEKLRQAREPGDIAKTTRSLGPQIREWLVVLAQTFRLQDAAWLLELDRVLETAPEELDAHRAGLVGSRESRLELVTRRTDAVLKQLGSSVELANSKVLFNPFDSPALVTASQGIADDVVGFREVLGIDSAAADATARRWTEAAGEVLQKATSTAVDAGSKVRTTVKGVAGAVQQRLGGLFRRADDGSDGQPEESIAPPLDEPPADEGAPPDG